MRESSEGRLRLDIGPSYRGPRTSGLSGPHRTAPQRPATVPRATGALAQPPPAGAARARLPLRLRAVGARAGSGPPARGGRGGAVVPPADVLVAVEMRAAGGLGVVEVDHGQASYGEASVELLEEGVEDLRAADLVAGPPEVRGVEAEGDALRVGAGDREGLQDPLQLVARRTHAVPA